MWGIWCGFLVILKLVWDPWRLLGRPWRSFWGFWDISRLDFEMLIEIPPQLSKLFEFVQHGRRSCGISRDSFLRPIWMKANRSWFGIFLAFSGSFWDCSGFLSSFPPNYDGNPAVLFRNSEGILRISVILWPGKEGSNTFFFFFHVCRCVGVSVCRCVDISSGDQFSRVHGPVDWSDGSSSTRRWNVVRGSMWDARGSLQDSVRSWAVSGLNDVVLDWIGLDWVVLRNARLTWPLLHVTALRNTFLGFFRGSSAVV